MAKRPTRKFYTSKVIVMGTGKFPIDMLRYDRCVPQTESDSHVIGHEDDPEPRTVNLYRYSQVEAGVTVGRWKSFDWTVVSEMVWE